MRDSLVNLSDYQYHTLTSSRGRDSLEAAVDLSDYQYHTLTSSRDRDFFNLSDYDYLYHIYTGRNAKEYLEKNKSEDYSAAVKAVLAADPELKKNYIGG